MSSAVYSRTHERAMISCMMQAPAECAEVVVNVFGTINPCYDPACAVLYDACVTIDSAKLDVVSLVDYLDSSGKLEYVGGMTAVRDVVNEVPSIANFDNHLKWVNKLAKQRGVIAVVDKLQSGLKDKRVNLDELIDSAEVDIRRAASDNGGSSTLTMEEAAENTFETLYDDEERIDLGLPSVDRILEGIPIGSMCTLAARPGCGKSTLATNIVLGQSFVRPVYFASLEMPYKQVIRRCVSNITMLNSRQLIDPVNKDKARAGFDSLMKLPIFIEDKPSLTISQYVRACKRMKVEHGVQFCCLDYLQRADLEDSRYGGNREQAVTRACSDVKNCALEYEQVHLVLAQLNRKASEGAPAVHHLRESGGIEQESDQVILLHGEQINQAQQRAMASGSVPYDIKCIVGKSRHSPRGVADMQWWMPWFRFDAPIVNDEDIQ